MAAVLNLPATGPVPYHLREPNRTSHAFTTARARGAADYQAGLNDNPFQWGDARHGWKAGWHEALSHAQIDAEDRMRRGTAPRRRSHA